MTVQKQRRRPVAIALAALSWLAIGLSAPIVLNTLGTRTPIDDGSVVAAGFDSYFFQTPTLLDAMSGLVARSGRLTLVGRPGQSLTPEQVATLLKSGTERLQITRAALQIGGAPHEPVTGEVPPPMVAQLRARAFETLQVRDSSIAILLPGNQTEHLHQASLTITPRRGQHLSIAGTATWRGQRVEFDADTGGPAASDGGRPLRLRLKSPLVELTFDGRVTRSGAPTLIGHTHLRIADARKFAHDLGIGWQAPQNLKEVQVAGQLNWIDRTIAFEKASVEIDANHAEGAFAIRNGGRRPFITGTLAFEKIDISRHLTGQPKPAAALDAARAWSAANVLAQAEDLIRLPLTHAFDADFRLSAKEFRNGPIRFGRAAGSFALKGGQLVAQIAEIELAKGIASGQLTANFNTIYPRIAVQGRLDKVDLADVSAATIARRPLIGLGDVTFELKSEGGTASDLARNLAGTIAVSTGEASRIAADLAQLWTAPPGLDESARTRLARSAQRGTMTVDMLEVSCALAEGALTCSKGEALAGDRQITGYGSLDIALGDYATTLVVTRRATGTGTAAKNVGSSITQAPGTAEAGTLLRHTILLRSNGTGSEPTVVIEATGRTPRGGGAASADPSRGPDAIGGPAAPATPPGKPL